MFITEIGAINFKSLINIKLKDAKKINVIVGPNAVGKSTLFEGIRLAKVMLANRIQNEGQQALISLGALSPHGQAIGGPGVDLAVLANDPSKDIEVNVKIELGKAEIDALPDLIAPFSMMNIQNTKAGESAESPLAFTQYLSSREGQARLKETMETTRADFEAMQIGHKVELNLRMNVKESTIRGTDISGQSIIALLERKLSTQKTLFSLFTADRHFPAGEQNLQLGSGDAQQQLMSYMSTPSIKYARLKQVILQNITIGAYGLGIVEKEFNLIFDELLPGKKLAGININQLGLLKVLVKEEKTGKTFDIDQMSSGEKGLILTFLFIRLSTERGGVVMLDEPELHLNSAVQAKILPFLKKHCVDDMGIQVFLCTHSPEIVRGAFDDEDTNLYHLRSGTDLTPILLRDNRELFDVFERLGNSPADALFTKGSIYVEGVDDQMLLQAGYAESTAGYKISSLGGRGEVAKEVSVLQAEESAGRLNKKQLFIFDNDRRPSSIGATQYVRVHQHDRYCFENYLLNEEFIYDLISTNAKNPPDSRGSFSLELEEIALSQIQELVIREVYKVMQPNSMDLRWADVDGKNIQEAADTLALQLITTKEFLLNLSPQTWSANFAAEVIRKKTEMEGKWRATWKTVSSGKRIIDSMYIKYQINMRKPDFKKEIIKRMAAAKTDDWRILDQVLQTELS